MTRLARAIWTPGPAWKRGYAGIIKRPLSEIEGDVKHSTEGSLQSTLNELYRLDREASWHFTVDTDGTIYQHYELEDICWHCGRAGDRRQDTSLIGNITLVGIEHVDRINGMQLSVLTNPQINSTVYITSEIRRLCPSVGSSPPTLRKNLWEHNWLSSTACPSGLIPWGTIIPMLEDDDMTIEEFKALMRDPNAFPELGGKSIIDQLKAAPEYTLDSFGEALKLASDNLRSHGQ